MTWWRVWRIQVGSMELRRAATAPARGARGARGARELSGTCLCASCAFKQSVKQRNFKKQIIFLQRSTFPSVLFVLERSGRKSGFM